MRDMTTRARFGSEKTGKRKKPKTLLDYDIQQAEALGYGPHYGDYKADHPDTRAEYEAMLDRAPRDKVTTGNYARTCEACGEVFYTTKRSVRKYCSPECEYKVKRARDEKYRTVGKEAICPNCGTSFYSVRGKIYCSPECKLKAKTNRDAAKRVPIFKDCECCGKTFRSKYGAKFCGTECFAIMNREKQKIRNAKRKGAKANG